MCSNELRVKWGYRMPLLEGIITCVKREKSRLNEGFFDFLVEFDDEKLGWNGLFLG